VSDYLAAFMTTRTLVLVGLVIVAAVALTWPLLARLKTRVRQVEFFLLLLSIGLVLITPLLRADPQASCPSCLGNWHLDKLWAGAVDADVVANLALFIAPALLGTLLWRAPWRAVAVAVLGSALVEVVQPLTGTGPTEVIHLVANSAGAVIGACLGAVLTLVADLIRNRRFEWARTLKVVVSLAMAAGLLFGYPAWAADNKQAAGATQLAKLFTGTKLADYKAQLGKSWGPKIVEFTRTNGPLTTTGYSTKTVARQRFSWNIFFAERCVVAEWSTSGFTTSKQSGEACTAPFHP
jgi:hypothetical protein